MKPGWEVRKPVKLSDVCVLRNGRAYSKEELLKFGKYPVLRVGNFFTNDHWYYSDLELEETKYCDNGDLLYAWSASFGPRIWEGEKVIYHYHIWRVDVDETKIDKRFLFYWFEFDKELIKKTHGTGTTMIHVSKGSMESRELNLPPLPEQREIVAKLDAAFAAIATATEAAQKNLTHANEIFESVLDAVFSNSDTNWIEAKLKTLTTKIGSGATPLGGEKNYKSQGISLIRSLNIHDYYFKYKKLAFLDKDQANELSNVEVMPKDVLLNITGASVARCFVVPDDVLPARVNQHVSIIRPIAEKIDSDFLHFLLISNKYKAKLLQTGGTGGSTRQAITKADIENFLIQYPELLTTQRAIVSKLTALQAHTQTLKSIYHQKLTALTALKQSLLSAAFSGALTQGGIDERGRHARRPH